MVSFVLVALWLVSTLLIKAWPVAWAVIGAGVPLLGWVTYVEGPMLGLAALLIGVTALRVPMRGLMRP
ncbi:DUF2484 family protein [Paenirhodobacter sp.]|uniref:DUF2484 family protein n=1 Tax=Paenirhodobacter sp. TaxID=1965326 RepID=UPI003B50121A